MSPRNSKPQVEPIAVSDGDARYLLGIARNRARAAMPYMAARFTAMWFELADTPPAPPTVNASGRVDVSRAYIAQLLGDARAALAAERNRDAGSDADRITVARWLACDVAHAALHLQLKLWTRCGARNKAMWTLAQCLAINSLPMFKAAQWTQHRETLRPESFGFKPALSSDEYYRLLADKFRGDAQDADGESAGAGGEGAPECPACMGSSPTQGEDPEFNPAREASVDAQVAAAVRAAAKGAPGTVPSDLLMWADEQARPARVDWRTELDRLVRSAAASGAGNAHVCYDRPARKQAGVGFGPGRPVLAALRGATARILVAVDTSGSMSSLGEDVLSELDGVIRAVGASCWLLACDAEVAAPPVRVSSLAEAKGALRGGGGTRFDPIFEEAAKLKPAPDAVVVITDSYGTVSQTDPGVQTVWALVGGADKAPAPWGRCVVVRD